jgi:hypothetical protein
MKTLKAALLAMTIVCTFVKAANVPLTLQGTVVNGDGSPNVNALVLAEPDLNRGHSRPASTHTNVDGSFTITDLTSGTFRLCVQSADKALLNPCRWSAEPPIVTVTGNTPQAIPPIVLQKGRRLELNVVADGPDTAGEKHSLLLGIWRANGIFIPLTSRSAQTTTGHHELYIPGNEELQLSFHTTSRAVVTDPKDAAHVHGGNTLIAIAAGESDVHYTVHIKPLANGEQSQ